MSSTPAPAATSPSDASAAPSASTPALTPGRVRLALLALALGGFGIGTTEFVAMGLLPDIARNLLPEVYAASSERANAQAGALISAYALGVVVGAPTIAAVAARFPRKILLMVLAVAFTLGTVASAFAPTFELAVVARFVAALPHGAYFGVASLVAASLMGPGKRAQGIAFVLSGLTIANVIGVPLVTLLGQSAGWRVAYLAVALLFAATAVAIWLVVPRQPGDPGATIRRELGALRRSQVWFTLAIGAVGFGGFFAVYSYVTPLATDVTGIDAGLVPFALAALGVGMTIGNLLGGRLADRGIRRALFLGFGLFILAMVLLALTAGSVVGLFLGVFLVGGTSSLLIPAVQTRLLDVAGDSQTLAAALNHSAFNVGNAAGAAIGGAVIAAGFGYVAPTWAGVVLAVVGVGIAVLGFAADRRRSTVA